MSFVLSVQKNVTNFLRRFPYDSLKDPRTQHWPLVDSFWIMAALVAAYLLMVYQLPKTMQRRKPLQLRALLVPYNLLMALLNAHICWELFVAAWRLNYSYTCQPCRVIYSKDEMKIAAAIWWFYFSKLLEFSDTLFFILRKKTEQLTFLHVYHHSTMFPLWWIAIKWVPTGSSFFPPMINSFVHIIMYSYYGLSAIGSPALQKYLWWKKYLTALQLVQFTVGLLWAAQALVQDCDFPRWICYTIIGYMLCFLVLFGRFYVRKYHRSQRQQQLSLQQQPQEQQLSKEKQQHYKLT